VAKFSAFKLTTKDLEVLQIVLKSYPAPASFQSEIVDLYDRINHYLNR
jgi:hypothetical protein